MEERKWTRTEVGQVIPELVGKELTLLDIGPAGLTIYVSFIDPTFDEQKSFQKNASWSMRSGVMDEILMVAFKPGSLQWMDVAWFGKAELIMPEEGMGTACTIIFVNGRNGMVKSMRMIGLPTDFSRVLAEQVASVSQDYEPEKRMELVQRLQQLQARYSTKELLPKLKNRMTQTFGIRK